MQRRKALKPHSEVYDGPLASHSEYFTFLASMIAVNIVTSSSHIFPGHDFPPFFSGGDNKNKNHTALPLQISIVTSGPNFVAASRNCLAKKCTSRSVSSAQNQFRSLMSLTSVAQTMAIATKSAVGRCEGSKATTMFANDLITSILCILMPRKFNERCNFLVHKTNMRDSPPGIFSALILGIWVVSSPLHLLIHL